MTLDKKSPGDRLRIQASDWNAFVDAARAARITGGEDFQPAADDYPFAICRVRNDSGADLGRFDVVGLGEPLFDPGEEDKLPQFKRCPAFASDVPEEGTHENKWAVLLEPVAAGRIGPALVAGVVPVQMTGADVGFAEIADGSTALQASPSGSARVLWADSGSGLRWAMVRIGAGGVPSTFPAEVTFESDVIVEGETTLEGDVTLEGSTLSTGELELQGSTLATGPLEACGWLFWCYVTVSTWNSSPGTWNAPAAGHKVVYRVSASTNVDITAITPAGPDPAGVNPGPQLIVLVNVGTSVDGGTNAVLGGSITLKHDVAATNAFQATGNRDLVLRPGDNIALWYDPVSQAWRPLETLWSVGCGLQISAGVISVKASDLAGGSSGLVADGTCGVKVNVGCGIEISSNAVRVKRSDLAGAGLKAGAGTCNLATDSTINTTITDYVCDVTCSGGSLVLKRRELTIANGLVTAVGSCA